MNRKIKPNRYKPDTGAREKSHSLVSVVFCLKFIISVAFISILSLASIFIHDFITQSDFFNIKKIKISGTNRVDRKQILELADLNHNNNIFKLNLSATEKLIASHPWIQSAKVKRNFSSVLFISVIEHKPLAIVKIENIADILINTQGAPFKEYNPLEDHLEDLPVISGLDLTKTNNHYMFDGALFNSIMDLLKIKNSGKIKQIKGDKITGISIETMDIYNHFPLESQGTIHIKLGFKNFKAKFKRAKKISEYIDKNFPERTICAMDLFDMEKVFIKTKLINALHMNLEKGV